uniref:PDZ domain-containing protein n=1 Tax=Caenorhabditis japonica TaxID=281687 RepID=A0A8R1DPH7_CAEJA
MASEVSPKATVLANNDKLPSERERNISEKKSGYEYLIVVINYRPGLKFGLGIKNVYRSIFVIKTDENSIVSGLFNVADRIIDVDGEPVSDNNKCKQLLVKALKERKVATLLIERPVNEKTLKEATDEMNEEHNESVMAPPDVRSIMRKMEQRMRKAPSAEAINHAPIQSALSKNKENRAERRPIIVEEGHKSVMILMDNEEHQSKLKKVDKKGLQEENGPEAGKKN